MPVIFQCMKGVNRESANPNYDLYRLALVPPRKDYIQIMLMSIGLVMQDMIEMIQKHIFLQWAVELQMAGILMDLVS